MPAAAISKELVRLMPMWDLFQRGSKTRNITIGRIEINMKHLFLEYWLAGMALLKRRNTLLFNRVCKNLEVLDELRGVNTQSLFTLVHCLLFIILIMLTFI